jgi:hypothetical protein
VFVAEAEVARLLLQRRRVPPADRAEIEARIMAARIAAREARDAYDAAVGAHLEQGDDSPESRP